MSMVKSASKKKWLSEFVIQCVRAAATFSFKMSAIKCYKCSHVVFPPCTEVTHCSKRRHFRIVERTN